jgi:hypothetical protein
MNTIQDLLQELYDKGLEFSMRPDYWRHAVILEVRKRDGVHVLAKSLHELRMEDLKRHREPDELVYAIIKARMFDVDKLLNPNSPHEH